MKRYLTLLLGFCSLVFTLPAATTYYVDFASGSDHASGTSPASAWQRAPGDPEVRSRAAATELRPGDRVVFKGGVVYRGRIVVPASGTAESPIVFDGNQDGTFGTGRAILDGSVLVTGWRPCESAEDCGGNRHWRQLYTTTIRGIAGVNAYNVGLVQGEAMLYPAQSPKPDDPFYDCDATHFWRTEEVPTRTSLRDERLVSIGDALLGAYVVQITASNFAAYSKITGWDEASTTVTYEQANRQPTGRYSIANSIHEEVLNRPGEYVFLEDAEGPGHHRLVVWPWENTDPVWDPISMRVLHRAFDFGSEGLQHVVIQGFRIQTFGQAVGGRNTEGIRIRNNEITRIRSTGNASAVQFGEVRDHRVEGNYIHHGQRANAIQTVHGENVVYAGNRVEMVGRSPLRFYHIRRGQMVDNIVLDCRGIHSNPFTIYVECEDILVARNVAHRSNIGLTLNNTQRVYVINNIFTSSGSTIGLWPGGLTKDHVFLNNIIGWDGAAFFVNDANATGMVLKNNILGGLAGYPFDETHHLGHNLYFSPRADYETGAVRVRDLASLFLDPENDDYRLHPQSAAIGRGVDVSDHYPRDVFPDFDFDADFAGNPRGAGGVYDIGPFAAPGAVEERVPREIPETEETVPPLSLPVDSEATIVIPATAFSAEGGGEVNRFLPDDPDEVSHIRHWSASGHWIEWTIPVEEAGAYAVTLRYAALAYTPRSIHVNGEIAPGLDEVVLPRTWGWRDFQEATLSHPIPLQVGENQVRLECLGGLGFNLAEIRFTRITP